MALRPGPPNLAGSPAFQKEVAEVLSYSQNATRDQQAQVEFWADGAGTYTPPGHWNAIAANEFVKENYSEVTLGTEFCAVKYGRNGCCHLLLGYQIFLF